jgi:CspA family cold shock protein
MKGTIKTLVEGKPFGFIFQEGQKEGEKDLFFHESELRGVALNELKSGDAVTFEVDQGDKGPFAKNVSRA